MIACVDVHYRDASASAACLVFADWANELVVERATVNLDQIAPYEPGQFFRRELHCILAVLGTLKSSPRIIVIDG
jgi:deoxyribonuclease V